MQQQQLPNMRHNLAESLQWLTANRDAALCHGFQVPLVSKAPVPAAPTAHTRSAVERIMASEEMRWAKAQGRTQEELFARFDPTPKLPAAKAPPTKPARPELALMPPPVPLQTLNPNQPQQPLPLPMHQQQPPLPQTLPTPPHPQ